MEYQGRYYDCRLLLGELPPIAPGQRVMVPIKLLRPELVEPPLKAGDRFRLHEQGVIAEGTVATSGEVKK
jgi:hypothetical protein